MTSWFDPQTPWFDPKAGHTDMSAIGRAARPGFAMTTMLALVLLTGAPSAWALGILPGVNQFYNGVLHPLLAPAHLLSLLALAVLAGQQGLRPRPQEVIGLAAGLMLGCLGAVVAGDPDTDLWLWGASLVTGLTAAAARPLPAWLRLGIGAAVGMAIGLGSADPTLMAGRRVAALLGSTFGAMILMAYASLGVDYLLHRFQVAALQIGVRIVASWFTACAVLMLALVLKKAA